MNKDFYLAFENRFRGSRELIKSRLEIYLQFIELIQQIYPDAPAIDIGCGRGEWLELLTKKGFQAVGVDLDQGMLQVCYDLELNVQQGDAITYLASLLDESQTIVSAFHLVEHISFEQLHALVSEALRVLKPGGLLIMETPNPENIVVATRNFYIDPTHLRPIPMQQLSFLPEFYGYARTKVLRLQESKKLKQNMLPTLDDVLTGVSPDYAVIAQKIAPEKTLSLFDEVFNQEYGLSFDTLASRFDARLQQAEEKAQQAEMRAIEAETRASAGKAYDTLASRFDARLQQAEEKAQQAEMRAREAEARASAEKTYVQDLKNSTSWKITAPLRYVSASAQQLKPIKFQHQIKILLQRATLYIGRRPRLKRSVLAVLNLFPRLKTRLMRIAARNSAVGLATPKDTHATPQNAPEKLAHLTPHARRIYNDLKGAIERHKKENA